MNSMDKIYDVIVIGLGGIGSAVAERVSRSGRKVLGLEQFGPVHDLGSSHGETRAIRKAYFEDERYVPLLLRSYELWNELEGFTQKKLLFKTGCVIMAPPESPVIKGFEKAARSFHLPHEILDSKSVRQRYGGR